MERTAGATMGSHWEAMVKSSVFSSNPLSRSINFPSPISFFFRFSSQRYATYMSTPITANPMRNVFVSLERTARAAAKSHAVTFMVHQFLSPARKLRLTIPSRRSSLA